MTQTTQKTIKTGIEYRSAPIARNGIDTEARTVELAFSSEEPVDRWFGREILDHGPSSVRVGRLQDGGPVLMDHDARDHVGVVESVQVGADRVGRAVVRFGNGTRATEVFQDVVDGIRKHISVGYRIHKLVLEEQDDDIESYRATDWEPYEVSFVSVPADHSVGVARHSETRFETEVITMSDDKKPDVSQETDTRAAPAPAAAVSQPTVDVEKIRADELKRINGIEKLAESFGQTDLGRSFINNGKSLDAFRAALLERIGDAKPVAVGDADIGMNDNEIRQYSFVRLINALANPTNRAAQQAAAYEFDVSSAAAERAGKDPEGVMIPSDVLRAKRDLTVGTATAGGHTVSTDLLADSFIDRLENAMAVRQAGATMLTGLVGNVAIPRQTSGATAYWVAESGSPTESAAAFDQVTMSPKTVGAFSDISRKLLLQSSIDIENFVRNDLALRLALAIDLAAINGSGASNQPTGILNTSGIGDVAGGTNGLAPTWAHIVNIKKEVAKDNAMMGSLGWLLNSDTVGKLQTVEKASSTAQFILGDDASRLAGYPVYETNQVPNTLDKGTSTGVCSALIFGNWADLLIGMWGGLDINVDTSTGSTSGTVRVVALQDVDIAVRHAQSFSAMLDALTA
jgi:HK97 family phage major capsid protein/HK97 family phage prohead protease